MIRPYLIALSSLAALVSIYGCGGDEQNTQSSGAGGSSASSSSGNGSTSSSSTSTTSSSSGGGGSLPACGNGILDAGEACDTAIPAGQMGACPSACDDANACTLDTLNGQDCAAACAFEPVAAMDGDGCCPAGQGTDTDKDCKALYPAGVAKTICDGLFHVPTIAAGEGQFAVGCVPNGSQNETPLFKLIDGQGNELASQGLLTIDGNYYNELQVSHHDGRFQVLYQYNCDDNGSWNVGWGWGCIDFREYDKTGAVLTPSTVFGEIGHNGHPVLDWSGTDFGVSWVSYDNMYFRGIDKNRMLVGAGKENNLFLGHDPLSSDDRNGARTHMAWDGSGYGIFSIIGGKMYFVRTDAAGQVLVPIKLVVGAFSQHFSGQFTVRYKNGAYFVVYPDATMMGVSFMKVSMTGDWLAGTPIASGFDIRLGDMFEMNGLFYVLTNDIDKNAVITVLDENAAIVKGKGGIIGDGPMTFPVASYDPATGDIGVAYLSKGWAGSVMFQKFSASP